MRLYQANPDKLQPEWEEMAATSCAVQNMWLQGTALGVAGHTHLPNSATGRRVLCCMLHWRTMPCMLCSSALACLGIWWYCQHKCHMQMQGR